MAKNKDTIRLTPKQKEVIKAMRKNQHAMSWIGTPCNKYSFNGNTLRFNTGLALQRHKLIEKGERTRVGVYSDYYFKLTEKGKNINL